MGIRVRLILSLLLPVGLGLGTLLNPAHAADRMVLIEHWTNDQ